MLKKKKTSLILASLLMLSCAEIMLAQPYPSSSYEINEGYRRLVKWTGPETNIDFTADPYLKEYVEDIWSHAFDGNENITSVKFSSTLTEIHFNSFGNCPNLETVEFSEEGLDNSWLTIQSYAFSNCPKLKSVILPKRLTHIGKASFDECPSLISFTLNKNHPTWKSSGGAIYTKEMDKIIKFPQGITGHLDLNGKVKTIGEGAFYGTMLSSIFIPSVETIEQSAFERSPNLKTVNFPNTLRCINSNAFGRCKMLKNMILPSSLETIGDFSFANCGAKRFVFKSSTAPKLGLYCFGNIADKYSVLFVPSAFLQDYLDSWRYPLKASDKTLYSDTSLDGVIRYWGYVDLAYIVTYNTYDDILNGGIKAKPDDGSTSNIIEITGTNIKEDRYYNLQGQRVTYPRNGIFIKNGKKVIKK